MGHNAAFAGTVHVDHPRAGRQDSATALHICHEERLAADPQESQMGQGLQTDDLVQPAPQLRDSSRKHADASVGEPLCESAQAVPPHVPEIQRRPIEQDRENQGHGVAAATGQGRTESIGRSDAGALVVLQV